MTYIDDQDTQRANMKFIRKSMAAPLLSREREHELALAWREQNDEDSLHELISSYTRLVISTASKFRNYGLPLGDLVQEGNIGLMQAAARFEPHREVRFSTYATWWIRSSIQDYILRNWSIVRTGTTAAQKSLFFNLRRLRAQINDVSHASMSCQARQMVSQELGVTMQEVEHMEQRLSGNDQSLNAPLSGQGEDDWQNFLSDERASPEEVVIGTYDARTRSQWLQEALCDLTEREQCIIQKRRLCDSAATLEELGRELGVSKERVRQLETRAMQKLKVTISGKVTNPLDLLLEE